MCNKSSAISFKLVVSNYHELLKKESKLSVERVTARLFQVIFRQVHDNVSESLLKRKTNLRSSRNKAN